MAEFDPHSSHKRRYEHRASWESGFTSSGVDHGESYSDFRDDLEFYDYSDCKASAMPEIKPKTFEEIFDETMHRLEFKRWMNEIKKSQLNKLKELVKQPGHSGIWRED